MHSNCVRAWNPMTNAVRLLINGDETADEDVTGSNSSNTISHSAQQQNARVHSPIAMAVDSKARVGQTESIIAIIHQRTFLKSSFIFTPQTKHVCWIVYQ
jgi:hypothetical protein